MTDFYKTRNQLKLQAALSIAAVEPGEALSSEDDDTFDGLVDPLIAQLAEDSIVYIGDVEQIELAFFLPLASLLANVAGPHFGSPVNAEAKMRDEATLRRLSAGKPTYEVLVGSYF